MTWVLMAVAGGLGAALRVAVSGWIHRRWRAPYGTISVNVAGTLALAAMVAADPSSDVAFVVGTGLLGGLTTFSTWMVDTVTTAVGAGPWAALGQAARLTAAAVLLAAVVIAAA